MADISKESVGRALLTSLRNGGVKWLRFTQTDLSNQVRTKALNLVSRQVEDNPELLLEGLPITRCANGLVSAMDLIAYGSPAFSDLMCPNLATLHVLPYAPTHAEAYASLYSSKGVVSSLCPRSFLERQVAQAREDNIHFAVGVEVEFILMKDGVPINNQHFANGPKLTEESELLDEVATALEAQSSACRPIEVLHPESGPGQYEMVFRYTTNPVEIADSVITARQTIHAISKKHGYQATFMAKPFPDQVGNGLHLHISCLDAKNGNSLVPGDQPSGLSEVAEHMVAGILKRLPQLVAITAPTPNSYRRIKPGFWTGHKASWALEDKESAVRLCLDFNTGTVSNVELKTCDPTANPYLAVGGLLAAALDGIRSKAELGPPAVGPVLPTSLTEAIANLEQSTFYEEAMGKDLFKTFIEIKKWEQNYSDENPGMKDVDVY